MNTPSNTGCWSSLRVEELVLESHQHMPYYRVLLSVSQLLFLFLLYWDLMFCIFICCSLQGVGVK